MKKQYWLLALALVVALPFSSCKKSDPPVVTTTAVSSVTETGAISGGTITDPGSSAVTERGVVYGTSADPTIADSKVQALTTDDTFTVVMSSLMPGTLYHLRAYATNAEGTGYGADVTFSTASLIKTIGVDYGDGVETYEFFWDSSKSRITKIDDYWNEDLDKTITYDYSVPGKLTRTVGSSATVYDINEDGMVTKEDWGNGEWAAYEYNNDGFLIKIIEHWGGADHLKMEATITNGNIMKHTTYDDDGTTVKRIKEFTYTTGENVNNIHQASMIDNNTKPYGNLFGRSSKKLVDFLEYWDPRTSDPKGKTTITYEFDSKNRPSKITRAGSGWQEIYTYGYYE